MTVQAKVGEAAAPGNVAMTDWAATLGTYALDGNGRASFFLDRLTSGQHKLTATYKGSEGYAAGALGQTTVTVDGRSGLEIAVNSYTTLDQTGPRIAGTPTGGYWIVWSSAGQDGSGLGVFGQRFLPKGTKTGVEFPVNTTQLGDQSAPELATLANGSEALAWRSEGQDGDQGGVFGQRYAAIGSKLAAEFRLNTTTKADQSAPRLAQLQGGGFVGVWTSAAVIGPRTGIVLQRFSATAGKVGPELRVDTANSGEAVEPRVTALSGSGVVVIWTQRADLSGPGVVKGRLLNEDTGQFVGAPFVVSTNTKFPKREPAVAGRSGGGFAVAWNSVGQDGFSGGIYAQLFGANGERVGTEFRVNAVAPGDQSQPTLAGFPAGGWVIAWTSTKADGTDSDILSRRYDGLGAPADKVVVVNRRLLDAQTHPDVAALSDTSYAITWQGVDTSGAGISAQLFKLAEPAATPLSAVPTAPTGSTLAQR